MDQTPDMGFLPPAYPFASAIQGAKAPCLSIDFKFPICILKPHFLYSSQFCYNPGMTNYRYLAKTTICGIETPLSGA
ncbi:hypothetical protein JW766_05505 [Candidatus Dojkabacteria bacterium]|nr:hypothetical protein [Candidatus Dojkabacteria bacterium]